MVIKSSGTLFASYCTMSPTAEPGYAAGKYIIGPNRKSKPEISNCNWRPLSWYFVLFPIQLVLFSATLALFTAWLIFSANLSPCFLHSTRNFHSGWIFFRCTTEWLFQTWTQICYTTMISRLIRHNYNERLTRALRMKSHNLQQKPKQQPYINTGNATLTADSESRNCCGWSQRAVRWGGEWRIFWIYTIWALIRSLGSGPPNTLQDY